MLFANLCWNRCSLMCVMLIPYSVLCTALWPLNFRNWEILV